MTLASIAVLVPFVALSGVTGTILWRARNGQPGAAKEPAPLPPEHRHHSPANRY